MNNIKNLMSNFSDSAIDVLQWTIIILGGIGVIWCVIRGIAPFISEGLKGWNKAKGWLAAAIVIGILAVAGYTSLNSVGSNLGNDIKTAIPGTVQLMSMFR